MLVDVTRVEVLPDYHLLLDFSDGKKGTVNIKEMVDFEGVFAPLADGNYFASVQVNGDIGTICWDNGADLAPDVLYSKAISST